MQSLPKQTQSEKPTDSYDSYDIACRNVYNSTALPSTGPRTLVMGLLSALCSLALLLLAWPAQSADSAGGDALNTFFAEPPRHSTGLTDAVQWDNYSLWVQGQRIFLHSGEFHTFRLPVPDLWLDIFQKMVAAGMNGVSVIITGALTHPAPGQLDFNDWRALQPMFDAAKQAGIFVVLRPGPYINAETTAGGLALWSTSQTSSALRTNASDIEAAWKPYINEIIRLSKGSQVDRGGSLIAVQVDNEYSQSPITRAEYFAQIEETYRTNDIVVPLTYNDPGQGRNFINGTGAVDIYGLDEYPQGFDCSHPTRWSPVVTNLHQYHADVNPSQPWYLPEFQGGAFDPWGGPGYDACEVLTGPDFQDVFYKNNWASNAKLVSYYMLYGGTNWGGLAAPVVYSSYDYGSTLRESRSLSPKFDEVKRQGLFLRSSPEFHKTDWIGNSSIGIPGVSLSTSNVFATQLRNPDTGAGFLVVRQTDSTSTGNVEFNLTVPTSAGSLTLPQKASGIQINGRQSKLILTDYSFGAKGKLLYSTANVLFAGTIGGRDVLFLYGDDNQSHEFSLRSSTGATKNSNVVAFNSGFKTGLQTVTQPKNSADALIFFADTHTASTFFAPAIPTSSSAALKNFFQFGTNETVLIGGPQLVRNASISSGTLQIRGDLNASTPLTLVVPSSVRKVTFNGKTVSTRTTLDLTNAKVLTGSLTFGVKKSSVTVPTLSGWKFKDSLPEIQDGFDDSTWVTADHTTSNVSRPLFGDGRVLIGCDYGFCENIVLWRGYFTGSNATTSVNLTINGGTAFAASVFINNHFINTTTASPSVSQANGLFVFPEGSVKDGEDNVITVIQDHMGVDEGQRSARGIPGFSLTGGNITTWKVQGKLGGYTSFPDKTRGLLNEGGLFGEREGWHLPGFDTSSWESRNLSAGLPSGAGVGFFVTTFELNIPSNTDAMMSFVFDEGQLGQAYRALLFVNGWQYGKRVANVGPQSKFPVPTGILNPNGENTVAVALWSVTNSTVSPTLELVLDDIVEGGVGRIAVNNPTFSQVRSKN